MRRIVNVVIGACLAASRAFALEIPEQVPVDLHGRIETLVEVDESSAPFPWNHSSRSPLARTRLMASAFGGNDRVGSLYVEGAARWGEQDAAHAGVRFEFEQADYLWRRRDDAPVAARLFANERRYFTSALGPPLLDDERVARYESHGGARVDGRFHPSVSWSVLGALLDDESRRARRVGYASARWHGAGLQAAVAYLADDQSPDSLDQHAIVKGEAAGFYRWLTVIVSFEQSGFDDRALFLPGGRFDWDGYDGSNFSQSMPDAGAAFAEARLGDFALRDWGRVDLVQRYHATGASYVNDLSTATSGEVESATGLFYRHDASALDARVVYAKRARSHFISRKSERLEAHAGAFLANGSEVLMRGAVGYREDERGRRTNENFVHAAVRRSMQKVEAGVHAMVKDIDDGEFERRFALEARVNWSANVSMYGRVVTDEEAASNDAVFWRFEVRPVSHVFVALGYGRASVGDAPYLLEDTDIGATGDAEAVYTFTVRGDF